jgi:acetylornithine deacetylase/succinyl-diaminopimelate desuccinylase-like protein
MKTVVATCMVWMREIFREGPPFPGINMLLVGNEENGEVEPMGTPHVLRKLSEELSKSNDQPSVPALLIAGERTGEHGDELWGEVCTQNRGVMRFDVIAHGTREHSGKGRGRSELIDNLLLARVEIDKILNQRLTLQSEDGWQSQICYPFIQVGTPGIYNLTPDFAILGVEIRPIPQDDLGSLKEELILLCSSKSLELKVHVMENGVACHPDNPYMKLLLQAIEQSAGQSPKIGRKMPGTSARFAPGGQGIVWGQTGIGPHTNSERHYIPSILPYYQSLRAFGGLLRKLPEHRPK